MPARSLIRAAVSAFALVAPAGAQTMDPDFAKAVKQWTTRPEFSSPLVDHLPISPGIASPKQVLGDHIGVPNKLHSHGQIVDYFRKLAAAAPDRVRILDLGRSNEGRPNIVVMMSSAANMARLETCKANLALLSDPRRTDAALSQNRPASKGSPARAMTLVHIGRKPL